MEKDIFDVDERLFFMRLPQNSPLNGKTILESRMGAALGLNILAILRQSERFHEWWYVHSKAAPEVLFQTVPAANGVFR